MRDNLPRTPKNNECAVVNLDSIRGPGTHWVAYFKMNDKVYYFDSFGNLPPPSELVRYFRNCRIIYNHVRFQKFTEINCGHLCLKFLYSCVQRSDCH